MILRTLGIIAVTLLVTACTAQLGYRYADTFIEWQLADFVDLDDAQEEELSLIIDEMHLWHAQQELPKYQQLLQATRDKIAQSQLQRTDVSAIEDALWQFWGNVQVKAAEHIDTLSTLSLAQREQLLAHLQERLDEDIEEEQEEAEYPVLAQVERVDRVEETLSEWIGKLNKDQQLLVRQWVATIPQNNYWLEYRQRWLNEFEQALIPKPVNLDAVRQLVINPQRLRTEAHQESLAQRKMQRHEFMWAIYQSLSESQQEKLLAKLDEYLQLLDELVTEYKTASLPQ